MHDKKVKIIYFSLRDSKSKAFELSGRNFIAVSSLLLVALFLMFSVSLSVFTSFYQNLESSAAALGGTLFGWWRGLGIRP